MLWEVKIAELGGGGGRRWQATGRIVVSGSHEGGRNGSGGEPGWWEVCGILWRRGAVGDRGGVAEGSTEVVHRFRKHWPVLRA